MKLLDPVGDLPLGAFNDNTIDLFGDAYEYLMQMYASTAGKSGGEFCTPQEVRAGLGNLMAGGTQADTYQGIDGLHASREAELAGPNVGGPTASCPGTAYGGTSGSSFGRCRLSPADLEPE